MMEKMFDKICYCLFVVFLYLLYPFLWLADKFGSSTQKEASKWN